MSRHPEVKWAQREDKVYITVLLPDAKNAKINLEPEGVFTFSATAGGGDNLYEAKLELFDKVNVEESKINTGVRSVFCVVEKAEKGWWKRLLRAEGKTPHYVKVDWDKWVDEDEADGPASNVDLGGMDFSNMGGMGGMGGMADMMGGMGGMGGGMGGMGGGMGGMGGMGNMAQMMAGMGGGMGGMGGMGNMAEMMGGMGEDLDDSDDEEQVEKPALKEAEKADAAGPDAKEEAVPSK